MKKVMNISKKPLEAAEQYRLQARELFSIIAPEYDFISRAFTLGRDPAWKRKLVNSLPALIAPVCVDFACGTGSLTFALAQKYPVGSVTGIDLTPEMLHIAICRNIYKNITWQLGDICQTNLEDQSVDIITCGYSLLNAPSLHAVLAEMHRVLKPGGVVVCLDVAKPRRWFAQQLEYLVLKSWGMFWSLMLHGALSVYTYLADDMLAAPTMQELSEVLYQTGFVKVQTRRFAFGMVAMVMFEKHR